MAGLGWWTDARPRLFFPTQARFAKVVYAALWVALRECTKGRRSFGIRLEAPAFLAPDAEDLDSYGDPPSTVIFARSGTLMVRSGAPGFE